MAQKKAKELLTKLRKGDAEYHTTLRELRKTLDQEGLNLAHISTSEEEIKVIKRLGQHLKDRQKEDEVRSIAKSIAFLRKRSTNYLHAVEGVMSSLDKHHLSPIDVNSSPEELAALMKLAALYEATTHFSIMRRWDSMSDSSFVFRAIKELPTIQKNHGLTPEDFGSSAEEIADLTKAIFEANARRSLESLQQVPVDFDNCLSRMRDSLKKADLTLGDIGTSEDAIEELRSAYNLAQVKRALEQLREFGSDYYVDDLRRKLTRYKLTLADVDSSEEEVALLNKSYHQKEAARLLACWRVDPKSVDGWWVPKKVLEHINKGELTPEEIGSTADELDSLRSQAAA